MASKAVNSENGEAMNTGAEAQEQDRLPETREEKSGVARTKFIWIAAESRTMTWRIGFRQNANLRRIRPKRPASNATKQEVQIQPVAAVWRSSV